MMRLGIKGLSELRERLASVRPEEIMSRALAEQAERMAQAVRDGLAEPQGAGDHDKPWSRTGALHDSIEATSNGLEAAVGSNDQAAAPQEMGTATIPPRPFLSPVAAAMGQYVANAVAEKVASALSGDDADVGSESATASNPAATILTSAQLGAVQRRTYQFSPKRTVSSGRIGEISVSQLSPDAYESKIVQVADNGRENKQARDVVVKLGLNKDQADQLHREISGEGYTYHEILQTAKDMFGK